MFPDPKPCIFCIGSGCKACGFTGFPGGCIPPHVRKALIEDGLDPDQMAEDVRSLVEHEEQP